MEGGALEQSCVRHDISDADANAYSVNTYTMAVLVLIQHDFLICLPLCEWHSSYMAMCRMYSAKVLAVRAIGKSFNISCK